MHHIITFLCSLRIAMCHNPLTERTELLLGSETVRRLGEADVLVVGAGGVGAYAAELVCRAGVGGMTIVDGDSVSLSNINRQLPALACTVGRKKVDALGERLAGINPRLRLQCLAQYVDGGSVARILDGGAFDFIIDAIDTVAPKASLICGALDRGIPVISSMGAGAKTDIGKIRIANLWETYNCGLSRAVRQVLRKRGYAGCRVPAVFSAEPPDKRAVAGVSGEWGKRTAVGTVSYMPAAFGCHIAQYVITSIADAAAPPSHAAETAGGRGGV